MFERLQRRFAILFEIHIRQAQVTRFKQLRGKNYVTQWASAGAENAKSAGSEFKALHEDIILSGEG